MSRSLLVKLGAIGDCIMLIPAAHALYQQGFRRDPVQWLCGSQIAPLLGLYPWIHPIAVNERAFLHGSPAARLRAVAGVWPQLPYKRFDLAATLYFNKRYRLLTVPTRAHRRVRLSHKDRALNLIPGRHHTDEFARILLALPDDVRPFPLAPVPPPNLPLSPSPRAAQGRTRVILAPGGARNLHRDDALRRWPLEFYVALARMLSSRGFEVLLTGGPDDRWVLPSFLGVPVTSFLGELSLLETLGLFADSNLVVTHDTGPLHLAGLTSTPLLSLFGPTDPHGRLPRRPGSLAVWGGERFACRPCYDGHHYAPCHRNLCLEQVTPTLALAAADFLLANPTVPPTVVPPSLIPFLGTRL